MPTYTWKPAEIGWAVFVAVATVLLTELLTFDAATITDWRAWAIAIIGGTVRAAAGAALAFFRPG